MVYELPPFPHPEPEPDPPPMWLPIAFFALAGIAAGVAVVNLLIGVKTYLEAFLLKP